MLAQDALLKVYSDRDYTHVTMVCHQGTTVAFAMDAHRRIVYSVLDLARQNANKGELDAAYWPDNPAELSFPSEIAQVGYAIAGATAMPRVKRGGRIEAGDEALEQDELDAFLSTTGRLSAAAPFQVLTDGTYVVVLRQAIDAAHADAVFKLTAGGCSGDAARTDYVLSGAKKVPLVADTLLCDRFLLVSGTLKPVLEVRYRRSRHATLPHSAKDTLGTEDMEGKPFYEPTQELSFIRNLTGGRFGAVRIPTAVNGVWRWQLFAHNGVTGRLDCFSVEQGKGGLFNTQGTQYYTSPDPQYKDAVFERSPGTCPFTQQDLVPVVSTEDHAETALRLDGKAAHVDAGDPKAVQFGGKPYTIEAWIKPAALGGCVVAKGVAYQLGVNADGTVFAAHNVKSGTVSSAVAIPLDAYTHVAVTYDSAKKATVYVNGRPSGSAEFGYGVDPKAPALIGAVKTSGTIQRFFQGDIDEVRLWNRARTAEEVAADMNHRLIGNEPGLVAYYRFDEGSGETANDQGDGALHATLRGGAQWVASDAPVGDHPGVRRDSFAVAGRDVASGVAAVLYYQHEKMPAGYGKSAKSAKRQARVLLSFATKAALTPGSKTAQAGQEPAMACVDLGVGRDGRMAQLPDRLNLPVLTRPTLVNDLDAIGATEQRVKALEAEVLRLPTDIAQFATLAGQVPALEKAYEISKESLAKRQNEYDRSFQVPRVKIPYELRFKTLRANAPQCIAVEYGSNEPDTALIKSAPGISAMRWMFEEVGESHRGYPCYRIRNTSSKLYMNVRGKDWESTADLAPLIQYHRELSGRNSQFYLVPSGDGVRLMCRISDLAVSALDRLGTRVVQSKEGLSQDSGLLRLHVADLDALKKRLEDAKTEAAKAAAALEDARVARQQMEERQLLLTGKQEELDKARLELAAMTGASKGETDLSLDMALLGLDRTGLSCTGALLAFACGTDAPALLDSATGTVVLYFRGVNDQFFAVYYDTSVTRSVQELAGTGGQVLFTARDANVGLETFAITVTDGSGGAGRCDLTIDAGADSETWRALPRKAEQLAAVLNGTTGPAIKVGTVARVNGTQVELAEGATAALQDAAHVLIGENGHVVMGDHPLGAKTLTLTSAPTATPATAIQLLAYDYDKAVAARPGVRLSEGSRLLTVTPHTIAKLADMPSGKAKHLIDGHGCRWRGEMPGRAYAFDGISQTLSLPAGKLAQVTLAGDVTMETWANPGPVTGRARLLHANSGESSYTLALADAPLRTALVLDGVDDSRELSANIDLAGRDFTVELWARRVKSRKRVEPLITHGVTSGRTDQTLHLHFTADDKFTFALYGDDLITDRAFSDPDWHHWAAVYVHATKQQILYRDGKEVGRRTASGAYAGRGPLLVGHQPFTGTYLDGQVDEVRVFGRARTENEINLERNQRMSGREPGLLGYWTFPDASSALSPIKGYQMVAGVGNRFVRTRETFPCGEWTHLAASFEQSWALQLDGKSHLEVAKDDALDVIDDLTIEVFAQIARLPQRAEAMPLISKGNMGEGGPGGVPYQLVVNQDAKLEFSFEESNGKIAIYTSSRAITTGFHRVAVVRAGNRVQVSAGGQITGAEPAQDIRFYIDGQPAGEMRYTGPGTQGNDSPLSFGRARVACIMTDAARAVTVTYPSPGIHWLRGVLGEVRLWNVARPQAKIGQPIGPREKGLIARWQFEENTGNVTFDSSGSYPAKVRGARWTRDPDPNGSTLRLYRNGVPALSETVTDAGLAAYGDKQLTLGGHMSSGKVSEPFSGTMEEVRLWRTRRTGEQILDSLFTRLRGEKQDLIAYWPFDRDSTTAQATQVRDEALRGNHLEFTTARPRVVLSNAPISTDTAQVRSALAAIRTPFHDLIGACPVVGEYADMQYTVKGDAFGVLKRCYGYLRGGRWHLVTGYKVGDLITEWVSQIQFDPQLVGYIEGAPPVPSENLTGGAFAGASSVEFTEADKVIYSLSTNRTSSIDAALSVALANDIDVSVYTVTAPLGAGIAKPEVEAGAKFTGSINLEYSNSWAGETKVSQDENTTRATKATLTGHPEDPTKLLNPAIGARYVPANTGFALVQSETADVFALRLAHTGALVAYRMLPNPDIPKDWNIITFPINPRYVKQGTLDGAVGFDERGKVLDPDYPAARDYGHYSYFKPREAYAIKRRIMREQQRLRAYYEAVSTESHAPPNEIAEQASKVLRSMGMSRDTAPSRDRDISASNAPDGFSHRDLINTYVWTADGGFFAESTEATDAVTQTTTGSYSFKGKFGFTAEFTFKAFGAGIAGKIDATLGAGTSQTRARGKDATRTFGLKVECAPPGDLQRYEKGKAVYDTAGKPVLVPGKVDAYRFLSFYLGEDSANFDDFYHKVVDPIWLSSSSDPDAAALREARQSTAKPPCWRVMHRVTFISRLLPPIPPPGAPPLEQAMRAENIESNYELIKRLEPYVRPAATSQSELADATRAALAAHLPELLPHAGDIITYLSLYYGVES